MILPSLLALGMQLTIKVDSVPNLNVQQVCRGIAEQGGASFHDSNIPQDTKDCLDSEQAIRDQLVKQWSSFNASDKVSCVNESEMGGESSYTELLTCLEMARDVRAMQNQDTNSSGKSKGK